MQREAVSVEDLACAMDVAGVPGTLAQAMAFQALATALITTAEILARRRAAAAVPYADAKKRCAGDFD